MPIWDGLVDKQYERKVRETCTPTRFELLIEEVLNDADLAENPLINTLSRTMRGYEPAAADLMSRATLKFLLGDNKPMMTATATEPEVTTLMRLRIHRQAISATMVKHADWKRAKARDTVWRELTDERIVEAIKQAAHLEHGAAAIEGISDWWQWLKDNWSWSVFFSIIGLLLVFI